MPSAPAGPLAVDLDVLKLGTMDDPVSLDDVERALYALTGWQKPQHLVDAALDVVRAYATAQRAGRVPAGRQGHNMGIRQRVTVPAPTTCTREHLDEHVCPAVAKTVEPPATDGNAPCSAPAGCVVHEGCPQGCRVAKFEATEKTRLTVDDTDLTEADVDQLMATGETVELVAAPRPTRASSREPALSVEELLTLDESQLRPAQRVARAVLLAGEQKCADCGVVKPLDAFYRDNAKLTRRMGKCADCSNKAAALRRGRKTPHIAPI